jgi:hypothetical protein
MAKIIRLEVDTGNGNTAIAFTSGGYNLVYDDLLELAIGIIIDSFEARQASDVARDCDAAIQGFRNSRGSFAALAPVNQSARIPAMEWFTKLRDACREHPVAIVYIIP